MSQTYESSMSQAGGTGSVLVDPPRVEWQGGRPFALARLTEDYARQLEALAHQVAPQLDDLKPKDEMLRWAGPYGARFSRYNIFLLDPAYMPLLAALKATYLALIAAMKIERQARVLRAWLNIQQAGEQIGRHSHDSTFIGTFSARGEGSTTRFGLTRERREDDIVIPHLDGLLFVTFGLSHFHETSIWEREDAARVTYAFDILAPDLWSPKRVQIPFDEDPAWLSAGGAATANS